ncbi:MAG: DUF928 domain-containing protein [Phormidesmis sp.]
MSTLRTELAAKAAAKAAVKAAAGSMSLLALALLSQPSWAQTQTESPSLNSVIFNAPPPPPGQGAPSGRRDGGASRGNCPEYGDLAALVPVTEDRVWGKTTAAQPTLWFYLPAAITPETQMELVVQDKEDNTLYETSLAVGVEAGTIAIALPETVTLPVGEPYYWTMALFCDPQRPASSVFVSGTIERVSVPGLAPLTEETARSLSQAQAYANAGIWHDALTVLAELQQMDKRDLESQAAWVALLEQVGLAQAAAKPVQSCCKAE